MTILFLDTYYLEGTLISTGIYEWAKDFIIPSFAIFITLLITFLDRRRGDRIRLEDYNKNEEEKRNLIQEQLSLQKYYHESQLMDLEKLNKLSNKNIEIHILKVSEILSKCNSEWFLPFSIVAFTNPYIEQIKNLDYGSLRSSIESDYYILYLNSLDLIDQLNNLFINTMNSYQKEYYSLTRDLDKILHHFLISIETFRYYRDFPKSIIEKLDNFKKDYNNFCSLRESALITTSYPKKIDELSAIFFDEDYIKASITFKELHHFSIELNLILINIHGFLRYYELTLQNILKGYKENYKVLQSFELFKTENSNSIN